MLIYGCLGFSKRAIDENPIVRFDNNLIGKWKAIEDTDAANYISIRMAEGSRAASVDKKYKDQIGYITYWNRHGTNPYYGDWKAFLSKVGSSTFLNVDGTDFATDSVFANIKRGVYQVQQEGYYLVKIVAINRTKDSITIALVGDPTLRELKSCKEVRARVTQNINNTNFYSYTFHLYRVKK